jgi:hypothetical protein
MVLATVRIISGETRPSRSGLGGGHSLLPEKPSRLPLEPSRLPLEPSLESSLLPLEPSLESSLLPLLPSGCPVSRGWPSLSSADQSLSRLSLLTELE